MRRIFSGIQPSGNLHLGNYLGAIQNWVKLQDEFDSIFCVVDMHAITVPQDPEELKKKTLEVAKIYLASGIDPEKSSIFIQSHVSEHSELAWILNTITKTSELYRLTQFKDKSGMDVFKNELRELFNKEIVTNNKGEKVLELEAGDEKKITFWIKKFSEGAITYVDAGILNYPVLMAADILLYDTEVVPVGEDQLQHIELTRVLAKRFNQKFGETFQVPEGKVKKETMRIMGLDDPTKKMSKSAASEYNYIALTDDAETVRRKIKKAVTDSGSEIVYSDDKPALKNLINIYSALEGKNPKEIEKMYVGKGYADFKNDLSEVIINFLTPLQTKINSFSDEKVLEILRQGAEKVRPLARKKLDEAKEKVGFIL